MKPSTKELEDMPTLSSAQESDLKIDDGETRIWLSRCSVEDGAPFPHTVYVETLDVTEGKWVLTDWYDGDQSSS